MGQSTDGQICFGIMFDEGFEFPWDADGLDHEEWWLEKICGFESWEDATQKGERSTYFDRKRVFLKEHPVPFSLVNYCSGDCPMYIIAVPGSCIENSRGCPEVLHPAELVVSEEDANNLISFCQKYLVNEENKDECPVMDPKWYLSSYWG